MHREPYAGGKRKCLRRGWNVLQKEDEDKQTPEQEDATTHPSERFQGPTQSSVGKRAFLGGRVTFTSLK